MSWGREDVGRGGCQAQGVGEAVSPLNGMTGGCSGVGKPSSLVSKALQRDATWHSHGFGKSHILSLAPFLLWPHSHFIQDGFQV